MNKSCTDDDISTWQKTTLSHRGNLDLATIFWFWNKVDENFDLDDTFNSILKFFDVKQIPHIFPRQLWRNLLGESKSEQFRNDIISKPNSEYERGILGSVKCIEITKDEELLPLNSPKYIRIHSKCNTFNVKEWNYIIENTKHSI